MKKIMAILNLTPDSFYPGSRLIAADGSFNEHDFVSRVDEALLQGADIIDLGACSTRPGSVAVSSEEEWSRLLPALELWKEHFRSVPLSVDTFRSEVAVRCAEYSDNLIINDISAGDYDPGMLSAVASLGCGYVAMHHTQFSQSAPVPAPERPVTDRQVTKRPATGRQATEKSAAEQIVGYTPESRGDDSRQAARDEAVTQTGDCPWAIRQLTAWYEDFARRATEAGLRDWWFDPGFGFGKTLQQNWTILRHLEKLPHERPILVGLSRKSMLHKLLVPLPDATSPAPAPCSATTAPASCPDATSPAPAFAPASSPEALLLTRLANRLALSGGASIFRVHDPGKVF